MKLKHFARILLAFSVLAGNANLTFLRADEATPSGFSRVYVTIQSNGKGAALSAIAAAGGRVHYEFDSIGAVAVTLPDQALAALSRNAAVRGIEIDPERYLFVETTPYGVTMVQAPMAIGLEVDGISVGADGTGVIVGVIDSGVSPGHEDLLDAQFSGYPSQIVTRVKGGGKPRTDTVDLTENDEAYWGRDVLGHGTHVSGTITAVGGNSTGVVGVSPGNVEIYMVKVFGDRGNWIYSSTLVDAIQKAQTAGAKIINMSLGGGTPSSSEEAGMAQLESEGVLLIAAAGNDGNTAYSYPASYSSVVSVGAVDSNKVVAGFSQKNDQVELSAPGVAVLSTVGSSNDYQAWSGTSMATPHVSGVAALLWSAFPAASNLDIRNAMTGSTLDLGATGKDNSYGHGLVQAFGALEILADTVIGVPDEPPVGGLEITGGPTSTDPSKNGSFDILWTTNLPSTTDVFIGGSWYRNSTLTTNHKRKFRGTKGATYSYEVSSSDGSTTVTASGTHQN